MRGKKFRQKKKIIQLQHFLDHHEFESLTHRYYYFQIVLVMQHHEYIH